MDTEKENSNTIMTSEQKSRIKIMIKYPEKHSELQKQIKINRIYDILSEKAE